MFLGDVLGGLKIKIPWGRGGGHIFHQEFGGVRCVPLVFAFIKSQNFHRPPISQMILPTISNYQIFKIKKGCKIN